MTTLPLRLPSPYSVFQPTPEHPMDNTALRATEEAQRFAQLLPQPAFTDTTPDFSKIEYLREDEVEVMREYQFTTAVKLDEIVNDARLLELAGHQVCLQWTRRMDQNVDTTKRDLVPGPINGIRLSVVR